MLMSFQSLMHYIEVPVSVEVDSDRLIEVVVHKKMAEESLSVLRMNGFQREDIYRMLDKGPWILAFDISQVLPRTFKDLQVKSFSCIEGSLVITNYPRGFNVQFV